MTMHSRALTLVADGQVVWRTAGSPRPVPHRSSGFYLAAGPRIAPSVLVAMWDMKIADLIRVDGGSVTLTETGRQQLEEWTADEAVPS